MRKASTIAVGLLAIATVGITGAATAAMDAGPGPAKAATVYDDPDRVCVEDEVGYWVRPGLAICVHIEGDGWRPVEVAGR